MTVNPCSSRIKDVLNTLATSGKVVVANYPPLPHCDQCSPSSDGVSYCVKYPLHAAALTGELELLKKAATKNIPKWHAAYDSNGYTVLHCAVAKGMDKVISWLLSIGADPNIVTKTTTAHSGKWNVTPLYLATGVNDANRAKLITLLLEHGANPTHPAARDSGNGATCLHNAAFFGELEAVRALLKHGADIQAKAFTGETAADLAIKGMAYASSPYGDMSVWPGLGLFRHGHAQILKLLEREPKGKQGRTSK